MITADDCFYDDIFTLNLGLLFIEYSEDIDIIDKIYVNGLLLLFTNVPLVT